MLRRAYFHILKRVDRKKYANDIYEYRVRQLRAAGAAIGDRCRIESLSFGSEPYLVTIGDHVTIGAGVRFITHDGGVWVFRDRYPDLDLFGSISIGDNCFIGMDAIILPDVSIGRNTVIGAGSVVTKSIPSDSVAAGAPARVLKSKDQYEQEVLAKGLMVRSMPPGERKLAIERNVLSKPE